MDDKKTEKNVNIVKEIRSWATCFALAVVAALFINNVIIVNAQIASPSMEKTMMTHDRVFGLRLAYLQNDPQRYDIVVFKFPDDESSDPFVKRVIGLPGETVEIIDGKVFIDGSSEPLDDSFVNGVPKGDYGPFQVPENSYFMMGDNRNNSWDSKDWNIKYVQKSKILGKIVLEWFPKIKVIK